MKSLADVALPCGVVITILPVVAALGTFTVTLVALTTENVVASTPPIETEVAPVRFVPVTVMEVPAGPLAGVKLVMVGVALGAGGGATVPATPPPQPENIAAVKSTALLAAREILRRRSLLTLLPASRL